MTSQHHAAANLARQFNEAARRLHEQSAKALGSADAQITDTSEIHNLLGTAFGSVMLQAFALELIVKALRYKHGLPQKKGPAGHHLHDLFSDLPEPIKKKVVGAYAGNASARHYPSTSLESLLKEYARAFEEWRYMYDYKPKNAALGELQVAFDTISGEVDVP